MINKKMINPLHKKNIDSLQYISDSEGILPPAHKGDAGYDLLSNTRERIILLQGERALIPTGVYLKIPVGYFGKIFEKSGLANKYGLQLMGGIIDSNYRGEIKVIVRNAGLEELIIEPGQKIAQIIFIPHITPELNKVNKLDETVRQDGGFGSTG